MIPCSIKLWRLFYAPFCIVSLCCYPNETSGLKSVWKWMSLYKWPLYDLFWPFFCHMYDHLSQNWGSDSHFEVLNRSYLWFVQKLWHKTQIFPFLLFCDFVQKQTFASFVFLCFLTKLLYQLRFRLIKHLTMTVWISVLWKITMWLAKKWPDMVIKWPFISCYFLGVRRTCFQPQVTSEAITFEPIKI